MSSSVEDLLLAVKTQISILRDQCHQTINSTPPAYHGALNKIWSALDLVELATESAERDIRGG